MIEILTSLYLLATTITPIAASTQTRGLSEADTIIKVAVAAAASETTKSAGLKFIDVPANADGPQLKGAIWYPCAAQAPVTFKVGFDSFTAAQNCPVTGQKLPLIVISHGVGGWFGNFHAMAAALAEAGFIVAAINHPHDSGLSELRDPGDIASMTQRPEDMTRLIDFMLGVWPDHRHIDPRRIGFFGFSRGGFTGLALVGGIPDWQLLLDNCPTYPGNRFCEQIRAKAVPALTHDRRVKVAVIADPAGGSLFTRDGLKNVTVPLQLWASERGGDGLSARDGATVAQNLPTKPDYRVVANSGHFSFLPCSTEFAAITKQTGDSELCADASGFDRAVFQKEFNAEVLTFFRNNLGSD